GWRSAAGTSCRHGVRPHRERPALRRACGDPVAVRAEEDGSGVVIFPDLSGRLVLAPALVICLAAGATGESAASVTVITHSPARNETDVRLDAPIRVQFSADIDPSTLEGQI